MTRLLLALLIFATPAYADTVVLVGDSTMDCETNLTPKPNDWRPEHVMELLTPHVVHNHAVSSSNSVYWATGPAFCLPIWEQWFPIQDDCTPQFLVAEGSYTNASLDLVPAPDVVVITLGINDSMVTYVPADIQASADRLEAIHDQYEATGAEVLMSPPMPWNQSWQGTPYATELALELYARGLVDFEHPEYPRRDIVHLTEEGCWMLGAFLAGILVN